MTDHENIDFEEKNLNKIRLKKICLDKKIGEILRNFGRDEM